MSIKPYALRNKHCILSSSEKRTGFYSQINGWLKRTQFDWLHICKRWIICRHYSLTIQFGWNVRLMVCPTEFTPIYSMLPCLNSFHFKGYLNYHLHINMLLKKIFQKILKTFSLWPVRKLIFFLLITFSPKMYSLIFFFNCNWNLHCKKLLFEIKMSKFI